ncbi:peptide-methionine (S)-S-oxide reductase [Sphingobacteriales bacterium UPWRP_1]|nr:peptide-methionine (S)-S-oxide reductase [Sphingobacteriales bacterium TSM_CSS]PSJ72437.1 peptide-methionine (S)-S-oxide reductase [Sphingobacteriales bacterium UPWRP_1]
MKSNIKLTFAPLLLLCCFLTACANQQSAQPVITNMENNTEQTTPVAPTPPADSLEVATLGGGCFWCLEAVYQSLEGVVKVESGYSGGNVKNPSYKEVCTGRTGHAEVVQVTFNPAVITYQDIIDIFWHIHDPTTLNRQGNDVGTQYRSAVFYHNAAQQAIAQQSKDEAQISGTWLSPIVTEIVPFTVFYKAEDYHQNYFNDNPNQPYCVYVVNPKVQKFRKQYKDRLKEEAK